MCRQQFNQGVWILRSVKPSINKYNRWAIPWHSGRYQNETRRSSTIDSALRRIRCGKASAASEKVWGTSRLPCLCKSIRQHYRSYNGRCSDNCENRSALGSTMMWIDFQFLNSLPARELELIISPPGSLVHDKKCGGEHSNTTPLACLFCLAVIYSNKKNRLTAYYSVGSERASANTIPVVIQYR